MVALVLQAVLEALGDSAEHRGRLREGMKHGVALVRMTLGGVGAGLKAAANQQKRYDLSPGTSARRRMTEQAARQNVSASASQPETRDQGLQRDKSMRESVGYAAGSEKTRQFKNGWLVLIPYTVPQCQGSKCDQPQRQLHISAPMIM